MSKRLLKDEVRIDRVMNGVVAGTSNQTSSAVDTGADVGYDEVTFVAGFGALTAGQITGIKVQDSADNASYNDVAGSASVLLADGNSNTLLAVTVRPRLRYLKCIVIRGTQNAVIDFVLAILSKPHKDPVAQPAAVIGWKTSDFPADGAP
jgi:hypothetical protein